VSCLVSTRHLADLFHFTSAVPDHVITGSISAYCSSTRIKNKETIVSARIDSGGRARPLGQLTANSSTMSPRGRHLGPALAVIDTAYAKQVLFGS
jgi:hypothetical protein